MKKRSAYSRVSATNDRHSSLARFTAAQPLHHCCCFRPHAFEDRNEVSNQLWLPFEWVKKEKQLASVARLFTDR